MVEAMTKHALEMTFLFAATVNFIVAMIFAISGKYDAATYHMVTTFMFLWLGGQGWGR